MDNRLQLSIFLWISVRISLDFYGYLFGYPWVSMDIHLDIHVLIRYEFSIQGCPTRPTALLVVRLIERNWSHPERSRNMLTTLLDGGCLGRVKGRG